MNNDHRFTAHALPESYHVVLFVQHSRNRELLQQFLGNVSQYDVTAISSADELPDDIDLCLLDQRSLKQFSTELSARKRAAEPVSLPYLLLMSPTDGGKTMERHQLEDATNVLIDDFVQLPTEQPVLQNRVESLLRTRQMSLELAEQTEQYSRLMQLLPEAVIVIDGDKISYANDTANSLFGSSEVTSIEERPVFTFVSDDDKQALRELIWQSLHTETATKFTDITFQSADGTAIAGSVACVGITGCDTSPVQLVIRDQTTEKERQRRLMLFARAIETASQGITIADARADDEPLIYANAAFRRITGYPTDEIIGRNCRMLQGENTDPETVAKVRAAMDEPKPVSVELLNYRRDGTPFWNQLDIIPVENRNGVVTHFLGLQQDITERKNHEQRLAVLDRILRHNIRNHLTIIRGYATEIERETTDEMSTAATAATEIIQATDDLLEISEHVRSFQGVIEDEGHDRQVSDLVPMLESLLAQFEPAFDRTLPAEALVYGHELLEDALRELFSLLDQHSDAGLTIDIEFEESAVIITLVDPSTSIPQEKLTALTDHVETQLDHAPGVQLWLVRWAVEASGGEIMVTSDEHSEICIRLVRAQETDRESETERAD